MVDHLVFFALRDDAPDGDVRDLISAVEALRRDVPGVVDLSVGEDFSGRSGQYTHGLFVRFEDRDGLAAYATHPAHLAVVEKLESLTTGRVVVDYES